MSDDPDTESHSNPDDIDRSRWGEAEHDLEDNIRDLASIATDRDEAAAKPPPAPAEPEDVTSAALVALADADAREEEAAGNSPGEAVKHRNNKRLAYAIVAAFFILTAAGAIAFLALRGQSGVDAAAPPPADDTADVAAPAAGDQGTQADGQEAGAAQATDVTQCFVNPATAPTTTVVTLKDKGVADPSMFMVQWDTVVTNEGAEAILVTAHRASSGEYQAPGWEGAYQSVPPGGTVKWQANLDNNAGGTSGPLHWSYIDKVIAVQDIPACADLLSTPSADTEAAAQSVALPKLPEGAVLSSEG